MQLKELLSKRLIFVSGKGGVGKTTVTILLGLLASSLGKKTLLVEMNSTGRVAPYFTGKPTPADETPMAPNLSAVNLLPKDCFEEYVLMQVRFKAIYDMFFNNKFVTNFLGATPGLNEILLLGKIYDLERKEKPNAAHEKFYDLVIVDAPATGHGLSALEVPHVLQSAVKAGPLHSNAVKMNKLFADAGRTAFCLVTLAEEMPVAETIEYAQGLREKTDLHFGPLFVNAVMPDMPKIKTVPPKKMAEDLGIYWDYYELARSRAKLNREYVREIDESLKEFEKIVLPFAFEGLNAPEDFAGLLGELQRGLQP